jgi:hypothetical protein
MSEPSERLLKDVSVVICKFVNGRCDCDTRSRACQSVESSARAIIGFVRGALEIEKETRRGRKKS